MDWSSVTPALITGAVGIAGVGGTLLAARISAIGATERDQLAEKRRIYAEFYGATLKLEEALFDLREAISPRITTHWRAQRRKCA